MNIHESNKEKNEFREDIKSNPESKVTEVKDDLAVMKELYESEPDKWVVCVSLSHAIWKCGDPNWKNIKKCYLIAKKDELIADAVIANPNVGVTHSTKNHMVTPYVTMIHGVKDFFAEYNPKFNYQLAPTETKPNLDSHDLAKMPHEEYVELTKPTEIKQICDNPDVNNLHNTNSMEDLNNLAIVGEEDESNFPMLRKINDKIVVVLAIQKEGNTFWIRTSEMLHNYNGQIDDFVKPLTKEERDSLDDGKER